jgi:hypothetical protein
VAMVNTDLDDYVYGRDWRWRTLVAEADSL